MLRARMLARPLPPLAGLAAAFLGALWAVARADDAPLAPVPAPPAQPAAAASAYAGAAECQRCHGEVHASWAASTHALTFSEAGEETLPPEVWAGEEVSHPPGRTKFARHGDTVVTAETLGPDGKPGEYRVTHQVGRNRIHMLLATLPDGRMQVLPSMREHGSPTWFDYTALYFAGRGADPEVPPRVAPGDPSFWTGPVRSWDVQCSRCHTSGREALEPPPIGAGPRSRQRTLGLDCEACHGPGAEHALHHDQTLSTPDPMVKQRALTPRQRVDACLVCHMEAELLVPGWKPGEPQELLEFLDPSLLDDPDRVDPAGRPLELVYAGVSYWSSRCPGEGGLTCTTCHDPHGGPNRAAMRSGPRDDAQCATCHAAIVAAPAAHTHHDAAQEGGRCVNCHMPLLTVERGHGAVTDHSISIPRPSLRSDRVARDACTWCHVGLRGAPPGAPPLSEIEIRRRHAAWWPRAQVLPAWLDALARGRAGALDAPTRLEALLDDLNAPRFARATAPVLLARLGDAARAALVVRAKDPDSLVRRRVADALPAVPTPQAWAALVALLDDPSRPVQVHAARAALTDGARLAADKPALARVLAVLEQETLWVIDDDLRWERLAAARRLAGDAVGAARATQRQVQLDPDNEGLRGQLAAPGGDREAVLGEAIRRRVSDRPNVRQILLTQPTWRPGDWTFDADTRRRVERDGGCGLTDDLWTAFQQAVSVETPAPQGLDLGVPIRTWTRLEQEELFSNGSPEDGWNAFHARFPGAPGTLALSPVAFDAARTQALVWILFSAGPLDARVALMVLAKRQGRWAIVADVTLGVS